MIDERIADRRAEVRHDRRRVRLRRTLLATVAVLVVVVLVVIERSPLVGLEEVRVTGTDRLDPARVLAVAELELGTSTLRLRLGEVEERIEALPLVRTAEAQRLDPLTVLIDVTEREPVLVATDGEAARLVDRDGVILMEGDLEGLPRVELADPPPAVGARVGVSPALANAHEAWRGLSGPLRSRVSRLAAAGPDELSLHLDRGIEVRFGRAQRVDEKVRALGAILDDLDAEGEAAQDVTAIDVRAPSAPVVIGR